MDALIQPGSRDLQSHCVNVRSNLSNDSVPMQAPYVFSFTVTSQLAGNLGSGAYRVYIPILKVEH